ncbi:hypothetical protein CANCADRAFT_3410 [Tortispora caseinolytica NRRL Y-17796]|uniref:3-hydroxyisobutyryl-CoA hydrolase n=1 Tax=Tortispora caseinolytica NRRL Y-17796 TaxID=767744 RepID=A0A1E4TAJ0_9ASCO|nr:hypothetical protein CANCADRAFT_3410 [Tortispora caseinolytica NRRL Y-17796]
MNSTAAAPEEDDVLFNSISGLRTITLNRPKKLNSLNASMASKILPRLKEWESSDAAIVLLKGAGDKALCAGGDIAELAAQNKTGLEGARKSAAFFNLEYTLNYSIATYSKPYISVMHGITMGGGVGLSVHAPFRIATEKTLFAMPETDIGFFPDVGGSFFLPRLDGRVGLYLALTSARLKGYDNLLAGIATHYVPSNRLPDLEKRLSELSSSEPTSHKFFETVNNAIEEFAEDVPEDYTPAPFLVGETREKLDHLFQSRRPDSLLAALRADDSEFAQKSLETILQRSPTSVAVACRLYDFGRSLSIKAVLQLENIVAAQFMVTGDFVEGVESKLIHKPPKKPEWNPASLEDVKEADIEEFFVKRPDVPPIPVDPAAPDYTQQPYSFGLPTEAAVSDYITGNDGSNRSYKATAEECLEAFVYRQRTKTRGVTLKVKDILERKTVAKEAPYLDWKYKTE